MTAQSTHPHPSLITSGVQDDFRRLPETPSPAWSVGVSR